MTIIHSFKFITRKKIYNIELKRNTKKLTQMEEIRLSMREKLKKRLKNMSHVNINIRQRKHEIIMTGAIFKVIRMHAY